MSTSTHPKPAGGVNTRQLWAAVAVLGIAVIALGASLVHVMTRPLDGHIALVALEPPTSSGPAASTVAEPTTTALPVSTVGPGETVLETPAPSAPAQPEKSTAPAALKPSASTPVNPAPASPTAAPRVSAPPVLPVPASGVTGTESNAPMVKSESGLLASRPIAPARRAICATCGRVESVSAVERQGEAQGVGAVAGGVLGAVLGNQVGKGNGKAIATVLGAVGGGVAGHTIEKNTSKTIVYQVQVRMEDGSLRTLEQSSAPAVGSAVFVEGPQMRPAESTAPASRSPAPAPALVPQGRVYHSERY